MFRNNLTKIMAIGRTGLRQLCTEAEEMPVRAEKGLNLVMLLGRVGRDAELRGTQKHPVVVFPLATNITWTTPDGMKQVKTEWHRISVFRPLLRDNVAVNIRKGDRVHLSGSLSYSEYTDANGQEKQATSIIADDIINLTKKFQRETPLEESF